MTYSISIFANEREVVWNGINRQSKRNIAIPPILIQLISIRTVAVIDSNPSGWTLICNQMNLCRIFRWIGCLLLLFCCVDVVWLCGCWLLSLSTYNSHGSIHSSKIQFIYAERFFFLSSLLSFYCSVNFACRKCVLSATVLIRYAEIRWFFSPSY